MKTHQKCAFPFKYEGKWYRGCVSGKSYVWCATSVRFGHLISSIYFSGKSFKVFILVFGFCEHFNSNSVIFLVLDFVDIELLFLMDTTYLKEGQFVTIFCLGKYHCPLKQELARKDLKGPNLFKFVVCNT